MSNIITSDMYRIKKGKSIKIIPIVAIGLVLIMYILTSAGTAMMTDVATQNMSESDIIEMQSDLADIQNQYLHSPAPLIQEVNGQNFLFFLFLAAIVAVFSSDFDNETYKNTLSFETNRTKVYFGKFFLTLLLCIAIKIIALIAAFLCSILFIGTTGLTAAFWGQLLVSSLLQLPIYCAILAIAFCVVAFAQKTSILNATYIIGLLAISIVLQIVSSLKDSLSMLILFDPMQATTLIAQGTLSPTAIAVSVSFFTVIAVLALFIGANHFKKVDLK